MKVIRQSGGILAWVSLILAIIGLVLAYFAYPVKEWCIVAYDNQGVEYHGSCFVNHPDCDIELQRNIRVNPKMSYICKYRGHDCVPVWKCW